MPVNAKICGISSLDTALAALDDNAAFLGFVHFARSPRHTSLESMAGLMQAIRAQAKPTKLVSVTVDPDDVTIEMLRNVVKPDLIQLHGKETPERVAFIRAKSNIAVIKALSIANSDDLAAASAYEAVADYLMFDAKPSSNAVLPGGLGLSFDWSLMRSYTDTRPWFLAGGLTPQNVAEAVAVSGAAYVDVSSGVESAPGVKDTRLISSFLRTVNTL